MKRCPECRRDYHDDSLMYCLEDGTALIQGSVPSPDEPATAILHDTTPHEEAATRPQVHTTEQTGVIPSGTQDIPKPNPYGWRLLVPVFVAIVVLSGFFGYRYIGLSSKQIGSIAVMPFVNDNQNPDLDYLSDGMTETLMNSLSQLPGLSVKARNSVFHYKGKETDAQTLGKELGVQAVLNGRMIKRGDDLTLFLELVDTNTGNRIWGEQYTEQTANLISLQKLIAQDVSDKLSIKLSGADRKKIGKNYTENAEAYQLYLQGRFFLNKRTPEAFKTAIPLFERALAIDPSYALAYSGLADSYTLFAVYGGLSPKEAIPKAKDAALKALSLDNDLAEAHQSLGSAVEVYDYDTVEAEKEYKNAIELNANLASAHQWYGELLGEIGRYDDGLAEIQRALDLDPLSLNINRVKGINLVYARRVDEGIEQLKETIALDSSFPAAHRDLAFAYEIKGSHADSVEEYAKWMELLGDRNSAALSREAFSKLGWKGWLQAMTNSTRSPVLNPVHLSIFYTELGEKDTAIGKLVEAYDERRPDMRLLKQDPRFDPIREDPRFRELYKKVGLP